MIIATTDRPSALSRDPRAVSRNPIQDRVDRILRLGRRPMNREERRAAREVAYGDHLKILLEDIRNAAR